MSKPNFPKSEELVRYQRIRKYKVTERIATEFEAMKTEFVSF